MRIFSAAVALVLATLTFARISVALMLPMARWDEQTNITVVTDSILYRTIPYLILDGKPFFEKPPLWYWIQSITAYGGGISPVSARILSAVSAIGITYLCVQFVRKRYGFFPAALTWSALLLSRPLFEPNAGSVFSSHTLVSADPDSLMILLLTGAFVTGNSTVRAVCCGLAVLTKGPVGFIPLLVSPVRIRHTYRAWIITLAVIFPWYAYMAWRGGTQFAEVHIGYHLLQRMIEPLEGHAEPPWFYLRLLADPRIFPPGIAVAATALVLVKYRIFPGIIRNISYTSLVLLAVPTLSATKLAWYILPLYPVLAVFLGVSTGEILRQRREFHTSFLRREPSR